MPLNTLLTTLNPNRLNLFKGKNWIFYILTILYEKTIFQNNKFMLFLSVKIKFKIVENNENNFMVKDYFSRTLTDFAQKLKNNFFKSSKKKLIMHILLLSPLTPKKSLGCHAELSAILLHLTQLCARAWFSWCTHHEACLGHFNLADPIPL